MRISGGFKLSIVLVWLFSLSFAFQNCAEHKLEKVILDSYQAPKISFSTNICDQARPVPNKGTKFVFIVDMSASNFGESYGETQSGRTLYYWDKTKGTDYGMDRLSAIENFLDNCGNQQEDQFAVIGFSKTAGVISSIDGKPAFTCTDPVFGDVQSAKEAVDALRERQNLDKVWYEKWVKPKYFSEVVPDSIIMGPTSYTSALECGSKLITNDLTQNLSNLSDSYNIFFMSDGVPDDGRNGSTQLGCNLEPTAQAKASCYLERALDETSVMRTAAISRAKDLRIFGVFYGGKVADPVVLDSVAKEGGTKEVVKLDSFANNQSLICDMVINAAAISYRPENLNAVSLSTLRQNGELVADSDIDGVSDTEEELLGWDPQNPRSVVPGILDGICKRIGGVDQCRNRRYNEISACDSNKRFGIGLNECDYKILGLDLLPGYSDIKQILPDEPAERLKAVDSDRDGIIDFVEIIKGLDPARADAQEDSDKDGVTNLNEIVNGTDPFLKDTMIASSKLNNILVEYVEGGDPSGECLSGNWRLTVSRLQMIFTRYLGEIPGVTDQSTSVLNHAQNEHMVLISYRLNPQNSLSPVSEVYYTLVPFYFDMNNYGEEVVTSPKSHVPQSEFILLGKFKQ